MIICKSIYSKSVRKCVFLLCLFFSLNAIVTAQENKVSVSYQRIPITKDTWLSSVNDEASGNNGAANRLKLKGQQEFILIDFDSDSLKRQMIESAILHVRSATPAEAPLMRLGASSVATTWEEGNGFRYRKETGSACFSQPMYKQKDWAYSGSTVLDAVFGKGHTIWRFSDCTPPDRDGWQACAIQPEVLAAQMAHLSRGIALFDEVGTTWSQRNGRFQYHVFPNRFFFSRESRYGPWLEVRVSGTDTEPPNPVGSIDVLTKGLPAGEALCIWTTPPDNGGGKTLGFDATCQIRDHRFPVPRYLIPMARRPGLPVRMYLQGLGFLPGETITVTIRPVDSAGNRGVPTSHTFVLAETTDPPTPDSNASSRSLSPSGAVDDFVATLNLMEKVDPEKGILIPSGASPATLQGRVADTTRKKIILHGARNETVWVQVALQKSAKNVSFKCNFKDRPNLKWHIFRFIGVPFLQNGRRRRIPDPLVPIRWPEKRINLAFLSDDHPSFLLELYIPHHLPPGKVNGSIEIQAGNEKRVLNVELNVWDFSLPDKLSFIPEMNAYGRTSPYEGYEYYCLAHEHRTCLNRLPYGWNGKPAFAPGWSGKDFDWKKWDKHVGPLLNGSAFRELRRDGEPVDVMYLPFSENWPIDLASNYTPSYWAEEALSDRYKRNLGRAFSLFAKHLRDKQYNRTIFEFYLNNKIYFREKYAQSSAPWIFDEPVNTQDFWALRWYGGLWQESVTPFREAVQLWFRADISYSQYARDLLWGIMDVAYIGGNTPQKVRMKHDEWRLWEKSHFFEYGSANRLEEANTQPALWCLSAWSRGAIGVLPWQTMGNEESWRKADQNALFYPGEAGPLPSVRLKAFTYGQQLVEYLTLWMKSYDIPRHVAAEWLKSRMDMNQKVRKSSAQDAGTATFENISPVELEALRLQLGEMISAKSPPYYRKIVDFSKDIPVKRRSPDLGYVSPAPPVESMKPDCDQF